MWFPTLTINNAKYDSLDSLKDFLTLTLHLKFLAWRLTTGHLSCLIAFFFDCLYHYIFDNNFFTLTLQVKFLAWWCTMRRISRLITLTASRIWMSFTRRRLVTVRVITPSLWRVSLQDSNGSSLDLEILDNISLFCCPFWPRSGFFFWRMFFLPIEAFSFFVTGTIRRRWQRIVDGFRVQNALTLSL